MAILSDSDKGKLRQMLSSLKRPVTLVNFTQELECPTCRETRWLLEEVSQLSDRIQLDVFNFITDKDKAASYGVDKIPATVIVGEKDRGIRIYGMPSGYEFMTLIEGIQMVASGDSGLAPQTRERLSQLTEPVHIQVFVTPT